MELQLGIKLGEEITDGKRFYTHDGRKYPSVTTILGATRDNTYLDRWKANNPGAGNEAISRGLAVHKSIEDYIQFDRLPDPGDTSYPLFCQVKPLLNVIDFNFIETAVVSPRYGFAGRVDAGGYFEGVPLIIDWKTSSKVKRNWYDYPLQLAAYVKGYSETYNTNLYEEALLVCMSPGKVQTELFEPGQLDFYWRQFQHRLELFYSLSPSA